MMAITHSNSINVKPWPLPSPGPQQSVCARSPTRSDSAPAPGVTPCPSQYNGLQPTHDTSAKSWKLRLRLALDPALRRRNGRLWTKCRLKCRTKSRWKGVQSPDAGCDDRFAESARDFPQWILRRPGEHLSGRFEPGPVTRTIPRLMGGIPPHHRAHVRADRREQIQLSRSRPR